MFSYIPNMAASSVTLAFIEVFFLFLGISGCVLSSLYKKENAPYMDEVFHIPQVQNYCEGKFSEWDPMITTLPGLYLVTVGIIQPISSLFEIPMKVICSTFWLRSINVAFAAGNLYLLYLLIRKLHQNSENWNPGKGLFTAFTLSIFPILYFFTFLYYTDSGSTFCVLLMYLLYLHHSHKMAALTGIVAVLFRQTNIIWVFFMAGLTTSEVVLERIKPDKKDITEEAMQNFNFVFIVAQHFWNLLKNNKKGLFSMIGNVVANTWPYICVGISFVCFVLVNGSIVVGAKEDHQVIAHVPQLFYFASFSCFFSFMHLLSWSALKQFVKFLYTKILLVLVFVCVSALLIWKYTYAHRYLLADNRHYTFYVWSKIYRRHDAVKYALIPVYLCAIWSMSRALQCKNIMWKMIFCLCICLNLVPSPLLEFRYFIVPYLIYRLNAPLSPYPRVITEFLVYSIVNIATLYIFKEKPFQWENISGYQRFMW